MDYSSKETLYGFVDRLLPGVSNVRVFTDPGHTKPAGFTPLHTTLLNAMGIQARDPLKLELTQKAGEGSGLVEMLWTSDIQSNRERDEPVEKLAISYEEVGSMEDNYTEVSTSKGTNLTDRTRYELYRTAFLTAMGVRAGDALEMVTTHSAKIGRYLKKILLTRVNPDEKPRVPLSDEDSKRIEEKFGNHMND